MTFKLNSLIDKLYEHMHYIATQHERMIVDEKLFRQMREDLNESLTRMHLRKDFAQFMFMPSQPYLVCALIMPFAFDNWLDLRISLKGRDTLNIIIFDGTIIRPWSPPNSGA